LTGCGSCCHAKHVNIITLFAWKLSKPDCELGFQRLRSIFKIPVNSACSTLLQRDVWRNSFQCDLLSI